MSRNKRNGANENEKSLYQRFMRISLIFPFVALLMSSDKGSLFNSMSENKQPQTNEWRRKNRKLRWETMTMTWNDSFLF